MSPTSRQRISFSLSERSARRVPVQPPHRVHPLRSRQRQVHQHHIRTNNRHRCLQRRQASHVRQVHPSLGLGIQRSQRRDGFSRRVFCHQNVQFLFSQRVLISRSHAPLRKQDWRGSRLESWKPPEGSFYIGAAIAAVKETQRQVAKSPNESTNAVPNRSEEH